MCYINFGGIGFRLDDAGDIPLVAQNREKPFRLTDLTGKEYLTKVAPATGWSQVLLVAQLFDCEQAIVEKFGSDLYLGEVWIGSSEL